MQPLIKPYCVKRIGVISRPHGLLHPKELEALECVDRILYAGDIGNPKSNGAKQMVYEDPFIPLK